VVPAATSSKWDGGANGPSLQNGIFAALFRGHATGTDGASGVTITIAPATNPTAQAADATRDFYFASTTRGALDGTLNATAANGGVLLTGTNLNERYSGSSTLPNGCTWEIQAGAAVPGTVFVQVFRPTGQTCTP